MGAAHFFVWGNSVSLKATLQSAVTTAMKARESARLQVLRTIMSGIKKKEVDDRKELTDAEVQKILQNIEKQARETLEQAKAGGRTEAQAEVEFEISIVQEFLPKQMGEAELESTVRSLHDTLKSAGKLPAGGAGMGALMKEVMAAVGARSDGKAIQAAVKKVLG